MDPERNLLQLALEANTNHFGSKGKNEGGEDNDGMDAETEKAIREIPEQLEKINKENMRQQKKNRKNAKKNAMEIANSILNSANSVSGSINQIANEMERKNKLDEYYMLQDKITMFEEELFNIGQLDKAYDTMQLDKIPEIIVEEENIKMLVGIFSNSQAEFEKFKQTIIEFHMDPVELLKEYLIKNNIQFHHQTDNITKSSYASMNISGTNIVLWPCVNFEMLGIKRMVQEEGEYEILKINGQDYQLSDGCALIKYSEHNHDISEMTMLSDTCSIYLKADTNITEKMIERLQKLYSNKFNSIVNKQSDIFISKKKIDITNEVYSFETFLKVVNREIAIDNLRKLYENLRIAVRKCKMMK